MAKKVNITLTVQVNNLLALVNPTQAQIESYCSLSDDNGGSNQGGGGIETFLSNVYINNDVKWVGATNDQGCSVSIDSIVYESEDGDTDFFTSTNVGGTGGRSGNVTATVKNDPNLAGQLDIYTINFTAYPQGNGGEASFHIDPKLQGNS